MARDIRANISERDEIKLTMIKINFNRLSINTFKLTFNYIRRVPFHS